MRLLHKGESLRCFRDSASVTYGGMLPSDLTLSALRFILSAKSRQSCKQDCETVDFCNSLVIYVTIKEINGFLGGDSRIFSEERKKTSEVCFLSSEVSFRSSELLFRSSVGNFCLLCGDHQFPR